MESFCGLFHDRDNILWVNSGDFNHKMPFVYSFFVFWKEKTIWRVWMWGHAGTGTRERNGLRVSVETEHVMWAHFAVLKGDCGSQ